MRAMPRPIIWMDKSRCACTDNRICEPCRVKARDRMLNSPALKEPKKHLVNSRNVALDSPEFHGVDPSVALAAMIFKKAIDDAESGSFPAQFYLSLPEDHPAFSQHWDLISEYVPINLVRKHGLARQAP